MLNWQVYRPRQGGAGHETLDAERCVELNSSRGADSFVEADELDPRI